MNPEKLRRKMYEHGYSKYSDDLAQFLRESEEAALMEFLRVLHPGTVRDTLGLVLILRVVDTVHPSHPYLRGIREVVDARVPKDWQCHRDHDR